MCRWHHPYGRKWRGTKSLLIRVKEKSEKSGLKLNIQKTKIIVSGPIISWLIYGKKKKKGKSDRLYFLIIKITGYGYCSQEMKRSLLLGIKVMTNLDNVLKCRDITLLTKICIVKAPVFPVVTCRCENWIINMTEHLRIDAFKLWCRRRLLRVHWS